MNNDPTTEAVVAATAVGAVVVVAAFNYVKVLRTERAKRREIDKNLQLDVKAIHLAGDRMTAKLDAGDYDGCLYQFFDDFNTEIEFQKTVVRLS